MTRFKAIDALISERQFDRARSSIAATRETLPADQAHRLTALSAQLEVEAGNLSAGVELMRQAIREAPWYPPHLYMLCEYLMNGELWVESIEVADDLIAWSEQNNNAYFLDDARLRKALCLKELGRHAEIPPLKRSMRPDIQAFSGGSRYSLADLD
jgi:hypothetical protein